jgi:hypothetical protein
VQPINRLVEAANGIAAVESLQRRRPAGGAGGGRRGDALHAGRGSGVGAGADGGDGRSRHHLPVWNGAHSLQGGHGRLELLLTRWAGERAGGGERHRHTAGGV